MHPNTEPPSSSNYGYIPDTLDESTSQKTHGDYQQTDDTDHHSPSAVVNNNDANLIPIRFPSDPLTSHGVYSRESTDSPTYGTYSREITGSPTYGVYSRENTDGPTYGTRHNIDNPGYMYYQKPRAQDRTRQLFHNPSFLSDMSEEPRHNTDNYQRYLWNKMRESPQISDNCTNNTYDEIENQHHALAVQN